MEHFDSKQGNLKEKNIYTLHLDTPRIVIVASIMLGLIAVSFLIGMNCVKDNSIQAKAMTASELIASGAESALEQNSQNGGETALVPGDNILKPESGDVAINKGAISLPNESANITHGNTADNVFLPTPVKTEPVAKNKKVEPVKKVKTAKAAQKETKPKTAKSVEKAPAKNTTAATAPVAKSKNLTPSFAIQIASYDKRSTAINEIENLKSLQYNAYLDNTSVNGKQFFRVRIGPLLSHEKAAVILSELHENSRYSSSYIVKQ